VGSITSTSFETMEPMKVYEIALIVAALLVAMAAGLLFAFATVVMPGLNRLTDREYIRSFQAIDGVVQDGQPVFGVVVAGSAVALAVATALSFGQLEGTNRWMLIIAALVYVGGGVIPTVAVNLRLNNRLQTNDVDALDDAALAQIRAAFDQPWNLANNLRTTALAVAALLLIVILARQAG
jgi:uncharacterized membrane protein